MNTVEEMWDSIKGEGVAPTNWETVTRTKEVDAIVSTWCAKHFNKSEKTPFIDRKWMKSLSIIDKESEMDK